MELARREGEMEMEMRERGVGGKSVCGKCWEGDARGSKFLLFFSSFFFLCATSPESLRI